MDAGICNQTAEEILETELLGSNGGIDALDELGLLSNSFGLIGSQSLQDFECFL